MAEASFPSAWTVWTQSQREAMFTDHVTQTCKDRGYSNDPKEAWYSDVTGGRHTISGHVSAYLASHRGRLDNYRSTTIVSKVAAFHICPDRSAGGSSGGSGTPGRTGLLRSAFDLAKAWLNPLAVQPQWAAGGPLLADEFLFSGVESAGGVPPPSGGAEPDDPWGLYGDPFAVPPAGFRGALIFFTPVAPGLPAIP